MHCGNFLFAGHRLIEYAPPSSLNKIIPIINVKAIVIIQFNFIVIFIKVNTIIKKFGFKNFCNKS